jgi:hypothetical protein
MSLFFPVRINFPLIGEAAIMQIEKMFAASSDFPQIDSKQ